MHERDAVDGAARRRQPQREGQERAARVFGGADVPRQIRELVGLDRAREEVPGLGRLAREEPLEVVGAQIARVGLEEVPHSGDGGGASTFASAYRSATQFRAGLVVLRDPSRRQPGSSEAHWRRASSDDPQLSPDLRERVERELQLVSRMRGRDDRPHARLVLRDGRETRCPARTRPPRTAGPTASWPARRRRR